MPRLNSLERDAFIPVISLIDVGCTGEALNINADYVAFRHCIVAEGRKTSASQGYARIKTATAT